jgi:hypothetical protein
LLSKVSDDWVMVSCLLPPKPPPRPPPLPPPSFSLAPLESSSRARALCLDGLGVTVQPWACCPLVWEWTLVIRRDTPLLPLPGLQTLEQTQRL